jgi:DNA-binding NtrC family response regulator
MKTHLLVVDDEVNVRELLRAFFRRHSFEVTAAATALEAQRSIAESRPHLIILDVALADSDGWELLATLKRAHPKLPVLMLTGMGFDEDLIQEALARGASGYASKTVALDQLLTEVQRALKAVVA